MLAAETGLVPIDHFLHFVIGGTKGCVAGEAVQFRGAAAVQAPSGGGHILDDAVFDTVDRFYLLQVVLKDSSEGFLGFALEDDALQ